MRYKVGDRVRIKSTDWYNENKDYNGEIKFENGIFTTLKSTFLGQIMTIEEITLEKQYILMEDMYKTLWTDEMIEGLVESVEDRMKELRKMCTISLTDSNYTDKIEVLLNDYEYIEENGKAYFVRKKKEYPKTYEECCYVLGFENTELVFEDDYRDINPPIEQWKRLGLLNQFNKLLICRDVYWKLYGEEMGLEKPWEPDWKNGEQNKFCIYNYKGNIKSDSWCFANAVLSFPTEEMRDVFYENFKVEIEICKELL